jgi:hypothetical protein
MAHGLAGSDQIDQHINTNSSIKTVSSITLVTESLHCDMFNYLG